MSAKFIKLTAKDGDPLWFAVGHIVAMYAAEQDDFEAADISYNTQIEGHGTDLWKVRETPEQILALIAGE